VHSPGLVVFSDLDGTLLDHATYSFEAARPALEALTFRRVPLVFCSSKTRAEIEALRRAFGNRDPFVSENGGAIFIPRGYFPFEIPDARDLAGYSVVELGTRYETLREAFLRMRAEGNIPMRGFGDMNTDEIARLCGYSQEQAEPARRREYDEPFILNDPSSEDTVRRMAADAGLRIDRGGRFFHLTGPSDKGRAIRMLIEWFVRDRGPTTTVGIGDSLNDLPMLRVVDVPVLVARPGGVHDSAVRFDGLVFEKGVGPEGWRAAVLDILGRRP
jgi:mannosyl-3-phosphoglycerate phosphatase